MYRTEKTESSIITAALVGLCDVALVKAARIHEDWNARYDAEMLRERTWSSR